MCPNQVLKEKSCRIEILVLDLAALGTGSLKSFKTVTAQSTTS